ncbi:MAG: hypothetical protein RL199_2083, partial [Pseudomonadota bacterium]
MSDGGSGLWGGGGAAQPPLLGRTEPE